MVIRSIIALISYKNYDWLVKKFYLGKCSLIFVEVAKSIISP